MFKVSHNVLRWVLVYLKIGEIMAGTCVQLSLCTSLQHFSQLLNFSFIILRPILHFKFRIISSISISDLYTSSWNFWYTLIYHTLKNPWILYLQKLESNSLVLLNLSFSKAGNFDHS